MCAIEMERFIVGTGRCGSTLLSRMIAEQPDVLSVFEFFNGLDMTKRFRRGSVDGAEVAALISQEHPFVTMVLKRGYAVEEITYPFGPNARYARDQGLPWVLVSTLPRLTDDPDSLFDELVAFAKTLPSQELPDQYEALFGWLAQRLGKRCWIERSGSSIDYVGELHTLYPQARFLHIHRDGHETALSMREHAAYRLAIYFLFQMESEGAPAIDELRGLDPAATPSDDDPVSRILASRPPVELYGKYWSQELQHGLPAAGRLHATQYREVRFEDVIARPEETLREIAEFFDIDAGGGWRERAAALVRGVPPTRYDALPADEQERLAGACRPGMQLLGRA